MFENLTERLSHSLRGVTGQAKLTEDNIKDTLRGQLGQKACEDNSDMRWLMRRLCVGLCVGYV